MERTYSRRELLALGLAGVALPGCRLLRSEEKLGFEFAESHVVGGDGDFMAVRHLKLKGANREIGRKLAQVAKSRHRTQLFESKFLEPRRAFFKDQYPNHYERALGVGEEFCGAADKDPFELGYNLDVAAACSTVYYPGSATESGHAVLSRNYDFSTGTYAEMTGRPTPKGARAMTGDPYVIEMRPDKGIPALYLCSYDLLGGCLDGVNAEGLGVALLANDLEQGQPSYGSRPGLGEIEVTRFVLDTCRNADEARKVLESVPVYYSFLGCHYIVGDRKGKSFVFEYSPDLSKRYFLPGEGKPQAITNHPLHNYVGRELPPDAEYGSFSRLSRMQKEIATRGRMSVEDIRATNHCVMQRFTPVGATGRPLGRTLWHSVYDLEARTLEVDFYLGEDPTAAGDVKQRRSGYKSFRL